MVTSRFHVKRSQACFGPIFQAYHEQGLLAFPALNFVSTQDAYNESAFVNRMNQEEQHITRFEPAVNLGVKLISESEGDLNHIRKNLYAN